MIDRDLVGFFLVATARTVMPGADMALVARSVLTHGRRAGYIMSLGISAGLIVHAVASALGLSAILMTSATLFSAVKLAGAVYLITLGVLSLRRAFRPLDAGGLEASADRGRASAAHALVQGFLSNLLNPKVALFYLTLLPQFIRPGDPVLVRSLLLAGIHVVVGLAWLFLYTYFLGRLSPMLRRPRVRRAMEGVTGVLLIGFGARLAWDRR